MMMGQGGRWRPRLALLLSCVSLGSTQICVDEDERCEFWASQGECEANRGYMHAHCPVSCESCAGREALDAGESPAWTGGCFDRDSMCGEWASVGECDANPGRAVPRPVSRSASAELRRRPRYMHGHCAASCKICTRPASTTPGTPEGCAEALAAARASPSMGPGDARAALARAAADPAVASVALRDDPPVLYLPTFATADEADAKVGR